MRALVLLTQRKDLKIGNNAYMKSQVDDLQGLLKECLMKDLKIGNNAY